MEPLGSELTEDETTTTIIQRFAAGDDAALAEYLSRFRGKFVRSANRMIRQFGIDEADLDAESAVDVALSKLSRGEQRRTVALIKNGDDFARLINTVVSRVINDQKKHSEASKRGGDRATRPVRNGSGRTPVNPPKRADVDLDSFQSPVPRAEDVMLAKSELEILLGDRAKKGCERLDTVQ